MSPERHVRATFTDETITVYQAFSSPIADAALSAGRFTGPFKRDRMTWIKPSFLWMMYRAGWGTKPGQERILAIEITRDGFEWALAHSSLSHFDPEQHPSFEDWQDRTRSSPVRVQWDPDRSLRLEPLPRRAIQIGLSGEAVDHYVDRWTVAITDISAMAAEIHRHVTRGHAETARLSLPAERPYPLPEPIRRRVMASENLG